MEGIPGAVGGGLRMNAGAMGAQTFENVVRVRYLDAEGNSHVKNRDELEVHYRHFPLLEKNFAVSAVLRATCRARRNRARLDESQEKRRTTQPAAKSAGCIFKNPASIPAGKLVDELGLKNSRVGNARVSQVHGNFIVNDGDATASEVLELIEEIKRVARKKRGIELETEVQIVGEPECNTSRRFPTKENRGAHGRARIGARGFACDRARRGESATVVRRRGHGSRCARRKLPTAARGRSRFYRHPRDLWRRRPGSENSGTIAGSPTPAKA